MKLHRIETGSPTQLPIVTLQDKARVESENRQLLESQLLEKRLELTPLPYEAHIQFSNFCNMSCIMCWNGNNPRTMKLNDELQRKIQTQLGPQLSILEPFSGSEPLVLTWEETRELAVKYGVMLCLTTNVQFLDEAKFHELKDITETLYLSVDSHIPQVLEKIRQRANTDKVLTNLVTAARLAREHQVECAINVVFLTYNAPFLADSIRAFAETGIETINVIQMIDINHQSGFFDPLTHFSDAYLKWIKEQAIDAAGESKIRLLWNVGQFEVHDFRENPTPPKPRKVDNDHWDWRMKHHLPGFCRNSYNRIRIEVNGNVAPCCYATEGQLSLGNLNDSDFEEIWNGIAARDLRRGMYTDDVPTLCKNCLVRLPPPPADHLLFVDTVRYSLQSRHFKHSGEIPNQLKVLSPGHLERLTGAPVIELENASLGTEFLFAISLGGENQQIETALVQARSAGEKRVRFQVPQEIWDRLQTNLGYWWAVWQLGKWAKAPCRTEKIQCLIKHEVLPRLDASTLDYDTTQEHPVIVNIGANKSFGFQEKVTELSDGLHQILSGKTQSPDSGFEQTPSFASSTARQVEEPDMSLPTISLTPLVEATGRMMNEARQLLAYGGLDGVMNRPLLHDKGTFPQFAASARGYELTDSTGQVFIDWVNGWGCNLLGHAHPAVQAAVIKQLEQGVNFGLMNPVELEVARKLTELIPCAEQVAFGKNGSDSLNAAIRIARASTGRDVILQCGFHGFHEWYTCLHDGVKGILPMLRDYVVPFEYNDIEGLKKLFEKYSGRIAGMVMEPVNMFMPNDGYLESVAALARQQGALLIFDEVVTAFRLANGGAQEYFNVIPDLACLGKAMANGLPLSAVVGKREFMRHLPSVAYGMTYRGETLSLAAANATLDFVQQHDVPKHLREIGEAIRKPFQLLAEKHGIRCELSGPAARMTFVFHDQGKMTWQRARSFFVLECLKRGLLTNGNLLASHALDQPAVERSLAVFNEALAELRIAIELGSEFDDSAGMKMQFDGSAMEVNGFADYLEIGTSEVNLGGWLLIDNAVATAIHVVDSGGVIHEGKIVDRPDIKQAFPDVENGIKSGFMVSVPLAAKASENESEKIQFTLLVTQGAIERFRCKVTIANRESGLAQACNLADGIAFI